MCNKRLHFAKVNTQSWYSFVKRHHLHGQHYDGFDRFKLRRRRARERRRRKTRRRELEDWRRQRRVVVAVGRPDPGQRVGMIFARKIFGLDPGGLEIQVLPPESSALRDKNETVRALEVA